MITVPNSPQKLVAEENDRLRRTDLPLLNIGEEVELIIYRNFKTEKTVSFKGIIISQKNQNRLSYSFSILKNTEKIVITTTFFYHLSPIVSIKKTAKAINTRRAKLFYLRRKLIAKKN